MQEEILKDIPDYEGMYQASSLGYIVSLERIVLKHGKYPFTQKGKVLKHSSVSNGYHSVSLSKHGKVKQRSVHSLVAEAFLNHKSSGYKLVVNHKNFNRSDNRVENLEIVTTRENTNLKHIKSSSQYTGVHWDKHHNKWNSSIRINGKIKHLGRFDNEYDAHLSYQKKLSEITKTQ